MYIAISATSMIKLKLTYFTVFNLPLKGRISEM